LHLFRRSSHNILGISTYSAPLWTQAELIRDLPPAASKFTLADLTPTYRLGFFMQRVNQPAGPAQPALRSSSTSPPVQLNLPAGPAQPPRRSSSTTPPVQLNPPPPAGPAQPITRSGGIIYTLNQPHYINCTPSTCNYLLLYSPDWTHVEYICRFNLAIHLL
jgi:hypothetical protein